MPTCIYAQPVEVGHQFPGMRLDFACGIYKKSHSNWFFTLYLFPVFNIQRSIGCHAIFNKNKSMLSCSFSHECYF